MASVHELYHGAAGRRSKRDLEVGQVGVCGRGEGTRYNTGEKKGGGNTTHEFHIEEFLMLWNFNLWGSIPKFMLINVEIRFAFDWFGGKGF